MAMVQYLGIFSIFRVIEFKNSIFKTKIIFKISHWKFPLTFKRKSYMVFLYTSSYFYIFSDRSSRSRSRDLLTPQSNGRARSSSASSHSRRRRSVSSSGTSVASSVDSTLSRMPPLEGTTTTNNVEEPAVNNNQRR